MTARRRRVISSFAALVLTVCLAGCGTRQLEPEGAPVIDPSDAADRLVQATLPSGPVKATFSWNLQEGRTRLQGQGVARYEAPSRLRLDLFGPRGTTYLSAALVDERFRLPPNARDVITLPSSSLLWAAVGIFQPPPSGRLLSVTTSGDVISVRYSAEGDEIYDFRFNGSATAAHLSSVERAGADGVTESLELSYDDSGTLRTANYRNWADFRDLEIQIENFEDATSFPPEIWLPGGGD